MIDFLTTGRKPALAEEINIDGAIVELKKTRYNYAMVQFQETAVGDYSEPSRIARFKVNGVDPTAVEGFIAGDVDTRIFQKGELNAGVRITTAEAGKSCRAWVQYYNMQ